MHMMMKFRLRAEGFEVGEDPKKKEQNEGLSAFMQAFQAAGGSSG